MLRFQIEIDASVKYIVRILEVDEYREKESEKGARRCVWWSEAFLKK